MLRPLTLLLPLFLQACISPSLPPCPYLGEPDYASSAGCLVVIHGRILVVDSRLGGLTPPGGKALKGESAQCAAHRETLEETGLDLIPRQLLKVFDTGFHLYHCEIHAGSGLMNPAVLEVKEGTWLPVEDFDKVKWRYPGQDQVLRDLLTN